MELVDRLQALSDAFGVAGFEDEVRSVIEEMVSPLVDECQVDPLGNLICIRGEGPTVMLDAHMDEVGFLVRWIESDGFVRLSPLGGWDERLLPGHRVTFLTRERKRLHGVLGASPPHLLSPEERKKAVPLEDLAVDVGAQDRQEAERWGLKVGTPAAIHYPFRALQGECVTGKAFDDRAGCVVAIEALSRLQKERLPYTLAVNFAVCEEAGLRGARTAAWQVAPKLALALEGTIGADVPGVPEAKQPVRLGKGPALTVADRSIIVRPRMVSFLEQLAEDEGIAYQYKLPSYGGTDAGAIHLERGGVLAGVVSVPCRYIHSPVSVLRISDLESTAHLATAFLRRAGELL